jgi:ATP-dependent helicase/nuclease subunit B
MMFDSPAPRWFTIPAHRPFVDDLAKGLMLHLAPLGPEALADATVLTPTRRAARALAEAFVGAAGGRAVLLPQIRAFGDLEADEAPFELAEIALELPAAIAPRRRRFELARLVKGREDLLDRELDAAGALELADALGGFLDSCQLEEVDAAGRVDTLVDGELARHWQVSAEFLAIALQDWPARLAELGLMDGAERQVRLLRALAAQWRAEPPAGVLIAAGSTGTAPATANLLAAVAAAPRGAVVLPGLDLDLADAAWTAVGGDGGEQHPQGAMKRLLDRAEVTRADVRLWPAPDPDGSAGRSRRRIINEALRPAEATADWLTVIGDLRREEARSGVDVVAEGLRGLSLVTARTEEEAATVAALLLRETLETPDATAALVTPDRDLARRVSAKLTRWGVEADSSAGAPLTAFPVGALLGVTAALGSDPADPVALLGLLKHPLVRLGLDREDRFRADAEFETRALRGARPRDLADIAGRVAPKPPRMRDGWSDADRQAAIARNAERSALAERVAAPLLAAVGAFAATFDGGPVPTARAARAHVELLETLARDPKGDPGELWAGPEGELAAALFAALLGEADGLPAVDAAGYGALVSTLLAGETVRAGRSAHARLRILGAIEARLVRADRLILAGLEEGVWPKPPGTDPFLSRPMRARLGLPPPERRVGLSAHDFAQAACAPDVTLLRTERRAGAPTVAARWLWRLETLARGAGTALPENTAVLAWARALDAPDGFAPAKRPAPKPPLEDRPRHLSVTRIETWVRNPYETYAREILDLRPLEPPDAALEASTRGSAVHAALERFAAAYEETPAEDCAGLFERLLNEALAEAGVAEHARAREAALSRNGGPWFADFEARRRAGATHFVEQSGTLSLDVNGRAFEITAKADRIELRAGGADILDFKTGQAPTAKMMRCGFAPQLTLTAAILQSGGFGAIGPAEPRELAYVRVTCRRPPGEELVRMGPGESGAAAAKALDGLARKVAEFDDPETPYTPWVAPQFRTDYGNYDHLARVWEWAVLGLDEDIDPLSAAFRPG